MSVTKAYYEMSEKQFEEMKSFYKSLGYTDEQTKKLSEKCFGARIKVVKDAGYSDNWCFYRRYDYGKETGGLKNAVKGFAGALMGAAPGGRMMQARAGAVMKSCPTSCAMMEEDAVMAMPEVSMEVSMEVSKEPEFNTAETHDVPENEEHSPLDAPQLIFSANVNTASWTYLRSMISRTRAVDKSFVRIEEIINSYPYKLKGANEGELFSVSTEIAKCPWNTESELFFVGLKGKKVDKEVRQNLSFLVDVSGSMEAQWVLVQMSMAAIISKLKKGDIMSVIAYSDETTTVVNQLDCGDREKCIDAILSIEGIGGCTNGSEGLENAYTYLEKNYNAEGNNRVFIFTDGDFNFGLTSEGSLKDFIYKKRETGIYLSVVGYGESNFKDDKMETLARNGNGNYTFVSNPKDILDNLWDKLISNLITVAKDVKISVELNPAYVSEYRLIGYDARVLTQKEFHDTEKAVDGIGSEHNVVALIELKRGEAKQVYSTRYVSTKTTESKDSSTSDEFAFIEVHYKSPDGENLVMTKAVTLDELQSAETVNMSIASMLAAFGLLVKDSEYKGNANREMLSNMLTTLDANKEIDTTERYSHFDIIRKYIKD